MLNKVLSTLEEYKLVITLTVLTLYLTYYLFEAVKRPELACAPGPFRDLLLSEVPLTTDTFWAAPWCLDGRLQTALAGPLRSLLPATSWTLEPLRLADGGTLTLHWGLDLNPCRPLLLVLPGLTGADCAAYVRPLAAAAAALDADCCVLVQRGVKHPLTSPRLYSALSHDDLGEALVAIRARRTGPLLAAGVSLGGLLVGGYLARAGRQSLLAAALAVSAPLDVLAGAARLESGAGAALSRHMARGLRRVLAAAGPVEGADAAAALAARSVREFDAVWTAPRAGFASAEEYYRAASLAGRLRRVATPLLCVCAADDPLQPREMLPLEEASACSRAAVLVVPRGGHIGFVEAGWWWGQRAQDDYLSRVTRQYFAALLSRPEMLHETAAKDEKVC